MTALSFFRDKFKPYRTRLGLSIIFHILTAIFTVISIPMIIPFFQILFERPHSANPQKIGSGLEIQLYDWIQELMQNSGSQNALFYICFFLVIIFFLKNVFRYLAQYFIIPVKSGVVRDLRQKVFAHYQYLPVACHKDAKKGDLLSRLIVDVNEVEWSMINTIEAVFKSPLIILGCIIFMLYISPSLTLFVLILLLFTVFIIGGISRTLKQKSQQVQEAMSEMNVTGEESLSAYQLIKSYSAEQYQSERFIKLNNSYKNIIDRVLRKRDLASPLSEFLSVAIVAILLWYGANQVFQLKITPDGFFAFAFAFFQIIEPAKNFSTAFFNWKKGMAAVDRINEVLQIPAEKVKLTEAYYQTFNDALSLKEIDFTYPNSKQKVLSGFNLTIYPNEIIGIKGPSGVGKSSIIQLLNRFYEPNRGEIVLDGKNIKEIPLVSLRQLFAIVDQNITLFHDTVAKNISFSDRQMDETRIQSAAVAASAHEFINILPNDYQTIIGDQGLRLSAGQRQRIALARAIYKNSKFLILDEATANIDAASEAMIMETLVRLKGTKTIIIIAHSGSILQICDRIIEIK